MGKYVQEGTNIFTDSTPTNKNNNVTKVQPDKMEKV